MKRWVGLLGIVMLAFGGNVVAQNEPPDYSQYRVLDVQELDLYAAPANTAAHLAPDGTRFAHFDGENVCFYQRDGESWAEDRCFALDTDAFRGTPEEVNWSPDGHYLTAPTFRQALMFFEETDIQVLDSRTGKVMNLTDDGVEGGLLSESNWGDLDMAPVWLDDNTLRFIRYAPASNRAADASIIQSLSGAVFQVDLSSGGAAGDAEQVMELPGTGGLTSYFLALDPASGRMAINVDDMDNSPVTDSLWQSGAGGEPFDPLASMGTVGPRYLGYSANGEWLMAIQPDPVGGGAGIALVDTVTGKVTSPDLASEEFVEPHLMVAGWAPTGDALAYTVRDAGNPDASGLYLAPAPGEKGYLVLPGEFYGTTCCMGAPIRWASNDVIMVGRGPQPGVLLVQVGL
ncbi:MAG: hypothetical protein U0452_09235 [Anaerolineae bacterium]